ncbi:hypothetical protein NYO67_7039 [Aspergillus flavus]|nr:hypothetical protein NYO67_7039 [Aspergillus flavus]
MSATSSEGAPDIQRRTCTARQPHTYSTPYVGPSQAMQGESSPSEKDAPNPPRRQQGPTVHTPYSSPKRVLDRHRSADRYLPTSKCPSGRYSRRPMMSKFSIISILQDIRRPFVHAVQMQDNDRR